MEQDTWMAIIVIIGTLSIISLTTYLLRYYFKYMAAKIDFLRTGDKSEYQKSKPSVKKAAIIAYISFFITLESCLGLVIVSTPILDPRFFLAFTGILLVVSLIPASYIFIHARMEDWLPKIVERYIEKRKKQEGEDS